MGGECNLSGKRDYIRQTPGRPVLSSRDWFPEVELLILRYRVILLYRYLIINLSGYLWVQAYDCRGARRKRWYW
jgi:hypothetical protein